MASKCKSQRTNKCVVHGHLDLTDTNNKHTHAQRLLLHMYRLTWDVHSYTWKLSEPLGKVNNQQCVCAALSGQYYLCRAESGRHSE